MPDIIYMDFELALRGAAKATFPQAEIGGCLYHLAANFKKRLQLAGVLPEYQRDPEFAQSARMILSMAFLPPAKLEKGFDLLTRILPEELQPVVAWFGDNYMGKEDSNKCFAFPLGWVGLLLLVASHAYVSGKKYGQHGLRRTATFPYQVWSVYERLLLNRDATNNQCESMNRRCQRHFSVDHPGIWRFIDLLRSLWKSFEVDYEHYIGGAAAPKQRKIYASRRKAIKKILEEGVDVQDGRTMEEFMRGIATVYSDLGPDPEQEGGEIDAGFEVEAP